ncbi:RNA polymerase sigma factor (sigma-70 family) [Dyadobacter jejuensis]|uniref:RNA polymerase sigma factor (Sigma-70 family) n=1 Tax=Dyadobacter jejuensis TaxID=1082580 RepID=A0A316AMB7_9BACT|nr:sigma-70 family RNA polymerase sigma factor [Dyadobacter jejuensis]PWJ57940.1 RNA polymerase sigma factor (sigma-70 family) [Dyadobacter jejuensis]
MENESTTLQKRPNDLILWESFRRGDRVAFENIYQAHFGSLVRYGLKISQDQDLIQDCIQDLFIELWDSRQQLTIPNSIRFYLLKSLRYKIIRQLQNSNTESLENGYAAVIEDSVEHNILLQETRSGYLRQLGLAMDQLPKRQREALHLRYFQGLSNEDVARLMGVNYQSACKFIYTALKSLRNIMRLSSLIPTLWFFI